MNNSKKMNLEGFIINLVIMHGMINLHGQHCHDNCKDDMNI